MIVKSVCSTPEGVTDWITLSVPVNDCVWRKCSTPEGVTDWITPSSNCSVEQFCLVLNARRRH